MDAASSADAHYQLLYTQDVLKKYKEYVETKLMEQLRHSQRLVETLQMDCQRLQREKQALMSSINATSSEFEVAKQMETGRNEAHTREMKQLVTMHAEQITNMERRHAAETHGLQAAIDELKRDASQYESIKTTLGKRDEEIRKLRLSMADLSSKQSMTQADLATIDAYRNGVEDIAKEALDFRNVMVQAVSVGLPPSAIEGLEALRSPPISYSSLRDAAKKDIAASSNHSASQNQQLVAEVKALDRLLNSTHGTIAHLIRHLLRVAGDALERQSLVSELLDKERELARSRIEEIQNDHQAEREALTERLEESRLRSVLIGSGSPTGKFDLSTMLASPSPPQQRKPRGVTTGVQTAIDVAIFSPPTGGASGASQPTNQSSMSITVHTTTYNRVLHEVARLQEENNLLRQTVMSLEAQRQRFLGFVNNAAVHTHVAEVLSGSLIDAI